MNTLDFFSRSGPELEVERDGSVCDAIGDGGVARNSVIRVGLALV